MTARLFIIAGPNGAGKTTFAREFLPNEGRCRNFVNADLIAAGLSPFDPDAAALRAGRLMLRSIDDFVERGESFAIETTLAGSGYARMIPKWRKMGYEVGLIFLQLPNPEMAIERVAWRVAQGGHDIPEATVRRRFKMGLRNFNSLYKDLVDSWWLYDARPLPPVLLERSSRC